MLARHRKPLHTDLYVPMLRAARAAGEAAAVSELMRQRREASAFRVSRAQRNAVLDLEAQMDAWVSEQVEEVAAA